MSVYSGRKNATRAALQNLRRWEAAAQLKDCSAVAQTTKNDGLRHAWH